ncbi:MAG: 6,7-dimethyl-8-ribityllumazine synthase [Burkholderiales bacterium]|nr:6,7-dimethyl-8-ribityllumazine synthase [Burkholderiales bacterium]
MRSNAIQELEPNLDGAGLRIGIAVARFNEAVGDGLLSACTAALRTHGVRDADVLIVTVPGALELPLALQRLAQSRRFDALIALGAVIRGETYHFEIVSNESASGITTVQLDAGIPVANGVLTCDSDDQAAERMQQKGADCAAAAVEMVNLLRAVDALR